RWRGRRLREPGHSRSRRRGCAGARARLEQVRALLDLESARRRGRDSPDALRALRARRARNAPVSWAAATALCVLVLDQLTKFQALDRLAPGIPVNVVDGLFSLTLVMNPGLAFGMLSSTPTAWRWMVALLSMGALGVLAVVGVRLLPAGGWVTRLALG